VHLIDRHVHHRGAGLPLGLLADHVHHRSIYRHWAAPIREHRQRLSADAFTLQRDGKGATVPPASGRAA
ncbi:MAG: hypothetical protein M3256_16680, partial [Actinomycetota bacterium]|nr:hypothetical protein [Actinomycetota bacterium]